MSNSEVEFKKNMEAENEKIDALNK